ncbi:Hypothetical predicted protein [Mytilus galloprovincialis]|uniref:F5/8 type C domain-containing protein n=1 Tax=Mytilus galloprovincialis TaxID=29158 RepID=A0A8B6DT06_MYTGA|nr:Hypothetical predicted protein [Mytilus galloprovincialis]
MSSQFNVAVDRHNIALGRPTKQLTTAKSYTSERAVDGKFLERSSSGVYACTHTNTSPTSGLSWWAVDLGGHYKVTHVVIYGRTHNCCSNWLQNFDIDVIKHPHSFCDKWTTFQKGRASHCHYQQSGSTFVNATCPPDVKGRFIRIKKRSNTFNLCLCEVKVYGDLITNMTDERASWIGLLRCKHTRREIGSVVGYSALLMETSALRSGVGHHISCRITCIDHYDRLNQVRYMLIFWKKLERRAYELIDSSSDHRERLGKGSFLKDMKCTASHRTKFVILCFIYNWIGG